MPLPKNTKEITTCLPETSPILKSADHISKSLSNIKPKRGVTDIPRAMTGTLVRTILPEGKSKSRSKRNSEPKGEEADLAKSKYMMKSIAGLLTTASVYAGLDNIQNADSLAMNSSEIKEDDMANKQEEKEQKSTDEPLAISPDVKVRKPTLFDISIVPKDENDSEKENPEYLSAKRNMIIKKLSEVFTLPQEEKFMEEFPSWILKDVLVQGHLFVTTSHLLFFAYLPKPSGAVKMSGNLYIRSALTGSTRYWGVLKDNLFSLYNSPTDIYFPVLTIDLRNVTKIEVQKSFRSHNPTEYFKIITNEKTFKFIADSVNSATSWCKVLKKQQFSCQNTSNNSISLKIPLSNILELEDQKLVNEASIFVVKALESPETFAVDDYVFMFLDDSGSTLKNLLETRLKELKENNINILYGAEEEEKEEKLEPMNSDDLVKSIPKYIRTENILRQELAKLSLRRLTPQFYVPTAGSLIPQTPNVLSGGLNYLPSPTDYLPSRKNLPLTLASSQNPILDEIRAGPLIKRIRAKSGHWLKKRHQTDDNKIEESIVLENQSDSKLQSNEHKQPLNTDESTTQLNSISIEDQGSEILNDTDSIQS